MKSIWEVIKGPVITEKALTMKDEPESMGRGGNSRQLLTLKVDRRATKPEIKKAVEALFSTKVDDVRVAVMHGKVKRQGRYAGKRPDWKKAYVVLKKGEKMVEFFEQA